MLTFGGRKVEYRARLPLLRILIFCTCTTTSLKPTLSISLSYGTSEYHLCLALTESNWLRHESDFGFDSDFKFDSDYDFDFGIDYNDDFDFDL